MNVEVVNVEVLIVMSVAGKFFWFMLYTYVTLIYFTFFGKLPPLYQSCPHYKLLLGMGQECMHTSATTPVLCNIQHRLHGLLRQQLLCTSS